MHICEQISYIRQVRSDSQTADMIKTVQILSTIIILLTGITVVSAQESRQGPKFISDIEYTVGDKTEKSDVITAVKTEKPSASPSAASAIESATSLQIKFAILLNTEVEKATSISLFRTIDQWLGTPYRLGGTTKKGIDCSAFVQIMYSSFFGSAIPRTCREQFGAVKRILMSELKEGDLIFFNTRGGVSHVGFYLQNNKFVHASSSEGVTITDLSDPYWSRRIIGAGRVPQS